MIPFADLHIQTAPWPELRTIEQRNTNLSIPCITSVDLHISCVIVSPTPYEGCAEEERSFWFPGNPWPKLMMVVLLLFSHQDKSVGPFSGCKPANLFSKGQKAADCDSADQY
jgi:hypothetical protein